MRVWGAPPQTVQRLAVLGGSGGEFINSARDRGAQIYVTGEVRHHQVPPESLKDFGVLEVGHYSSEAVFMSPWAEQLRGLFAAVGLAVRVEVAQSSQAATGLTNLCCLTKTVTDIPDDGATTVCPPEG